MHKIRKLCMKFDHLILMKIIKLVIIVVIIKFL